MAVGDLFDIFQGVGKSPAPFVVITVPGDPQGKKAHESRWVPPNPARGRFKGFIHNYLPKQTEVYQNKIAATAKRAMAGRPMIPAGEPFAMRMFIVLPVPKSWPRRDRDAALAGTIWPTVKPDDDNVSKALDALNGVVWADDAQRCRSLLWKDYGEKPGLIIEVYKLV